MRIPTSLKGGENMERERGILGEFSGDGGGRELASI
jgi:hypothetical protein